jgi:diguanylate cyclase (GGDEF)-like protein
MFPEMSIDTAQTVGKRIHTLLDKTRIPHEHTDIAFTVSIGISEFCYTDTVSTIFNRADKALYHAKEAGGNRVCIV